MRFFLAIGCATILAGCASTQQPKTYLWVRTDGQSGKNNPALQQQGEIDKQVCNGETIKARMAAGHANYANETSLSGAFVAGTLEGQKNLDAIEVFKGCMASRGYVLTPTEEAEAVSKSFAETKKERDKTK
jgi:hypothetical protein